MQVKTVRALGSFVRAQRREQGLTQADLAARLGVSRDWVVRLERGHPRLEAQRVLDALVVLGVTLDLEAAPTAPAPASGSRNRTVRTAASKKAAETATRTTDPEAKDRRGRPGPATSPTGGKGDVTGKAGHARSDDRSARDARAARTEDPFAYLTEGF